MTIEQLENYRANKVELSAITEEIEDSEEVIGVQSAAKFPYAVHTVTQSGIPGTPANVRLLERQHSLDHLQDHRRQGQGDDTAQIHEAARARSYMAGDSRPLWLHRRRYTSEED